MDFEINLVFLIETFFLHDKNLNILRTTRAFSSFLEGFQLSKIVSGLRVHF